MDPKCQYIKIKQSKLFLLKQVPIFIKASNDQFTLYKAENISVDKTLFLGDELPDLYILQSDRDTAIEESKAALNLELYHKLKAGGLVHVKAVMLKIVDEALFDNSTQNFNQLPETIELLFKEYSRQNNLLLKLIHISQRDRNLVEHCTNVMFFVLNFCIYCNYPIDATTEISLAGLLHDIGKTKLPANLCAIDHRLTDEEFAHYKTHTLIGHDILIGNSSLLNSAAEAALEHHERIDASGYPRGITHISPISQLIGLIDSFEQLAYREKAYRQVKKPFDAMFKIKDEILAEGKFTKEVFKDFCKSLRE